MAINKGDTVTAHYTGKFDDGTVFDSSEGREPLSFVVGSGKVIKGFDDAVIGMSVGESKTFTVLAKDAYGERDPTYVQKIERSRLPADQEPKVGMLLGVRIPEGPEMQVEIIAVDDKEVTLDFNHPLAGKNLTFTITLQ